MPTYGTAYDGTSSWQANSDASFDNLRSDLIFLTCNLMFLMEI